MIANIGMNLPKYTYIETRLYPNSQNLRWIWLSVLIIALDQATKFAAELYLQHPLHLLPFFDLILAHNDGAAFSFLHNAGGWQRYFLIAITLIVLILLVRWLWKLNTANMLLAIGLALIIGGAVGNLIDRASTGQVVDFISIYYANWRWPAFNIADSSITIGVSLLLIDALLFCETA